MQSSVLWDPESQIRHSFEKPCQNRSLEGLGTLGKLGLEGLLLFLYPNLLSSGLIYRLEGGGEGFSPSSLVSSSITCLGVILWLHLSSLTLLLYFYCFLFMFMHQSNYRFIALHLLLFCTQISQCRSNLAIFFNWGSKQALVFLHNFELSIGIKANIKHSCKSQLYMGELRLWFLDLETPVYGYTSLSSIGLKQQGDCFFGVVFRRRLWWLIGEDKATKE